MKLLWLLVLALVGISVLTLLWVASVLGRVQWRLAYSNLFVAFAMLFIWQSVWHEISFEIILLVAVLGCALIWLLARLWGQKVSAPGREQLRLVGSYTPWLLGILLLRTTFVEPFQIPSNSMQPTLTTGDFLLVSKLSYGLRLPLIGEVWKHSAFARGDIVVFSPPHQQRQYVKRIIGLPGDRIELKRQRLYINGEQVPLVCGSTAPPAGQPLQCIERLEGAAHALQLFNPIGKGYGPEVVPENAYLVFGDNRDNSSDSRVWGLVPAGNIQGKAFWMWMYWPDWGSLPDFSTFGPLGLKE